MYQPSLTGRLAMAKMRAQNSSKRLHTLNQNADNFGANLKRIAKDFREIAAEIDTIANEFVKK